MIDYPLKFEPILKEKIWGGAKLETLLNKKSTTKNTGESWEISTVPGNISKVSNGPLQGKTLLELITDHKGDLIGQKIYDHFGNEFPLLIKFIDAKTDLSVQLHPNDQLAKERHNSFGKTEMWYIIQTDDDAELNIGFKKNLEKNDYLKSLEDGSLISLLNFEKVKPGDAFFIPTGKVHSIGGGILLAEIQQTSDITYRIHDWDRTDEKGISRELHTELAIDAIDFKKNDDFRLTYSKQLNSTIPIASCPYFTTNIIKIQGLQNKDYSFLDSFVIYMCVFGNASVNILEQEVSLGYGETILISAQSDMVNIEATDCEILEIFVKS